VLNYLEYLEIDLEREYSVNRFGDRYEFINKYIDKIGVEVYDGELNEGKRNKNYNIFINLKFELDEDDYDSILKIKNNMKQNYNLYVLENKISYSYTLMHKVLLVLQITINLSIHSKNKVFSKITNIKIN
jgi:outer membrane receptor for ferric coprogen and ferric-rhodotorulic acid